MQSTRGKKDAFIAFRTTRDQGQKIDSLAAETGLNLSDVMRAVVEMADVELVRHMLSVNRTRGLSK